MLPFEWIVQMADADTRIDCFLAEKQETFTRSALKKLFDSGEILVNGQSKPKNYKLKAGDNITLAHRGAAKASSGIPVKAESFPLEIVYEDDHILVVNKSKGMTVHPSAAGESGTLVNALLFHCKGGLPDTENALRPGIVHRIDKDTSGLLVIAKTANALTMLAEQAEAHTMTRKYVGVVHGNLKQDTGAIDAPIGRHPVHRTRNCVIEGGRKAVTQYRVIERLRGFTYAEFTLETGRMHQIRVHMAHIGHPLAGDILYAAAKPLKQLHGQCLHAKTLGFTHPATLERMEFTADPPQYFVDFINEHAMED